MTRFGNSLYYRKGVPKSFALVTSLPRACLVSVFLTAPAKSIANAASQ